MKPQASCNVLGRLTGLYPRSIDLTLDRPRRLLGSLSHPERHLPPIVHIAGTNGKGSTLAMIRAGLESADRAVHAYISPHLTKFHERIRIAGELISESELYAVLVECEQVNQGKSITLFEITTCAAFLAFTRNPADYLLLEVGLGGRLDATNVIEDPALTVITAVSADHQQYLGETLREIASEKAGILKPGVPCIVTRQVPEAMQAIESIASGKGAPLLVQDRDWSVSSDRGNLVFTCGRHRLDLPRPNLVGAHQIENAGAAIMALMHLGYGKEEAQMAVSRADWPGRMQKLTSGPIVEAAKSSEIWLDGGHNPAAGAALARTLLGMPARTTRLICGMLENKDIRGFLLSLRAVSNRLYGVPIPGQDAALPARSVAQAASEVGFAAEAEETVLDAVRRISSEFPPGGRILVCGSLYLAGQLLSENG